MAARLKHLVITGASSGIGLATATLFDRAGYRVINLSRRPCPIKKVDSIQCDLSVSDFAVPLESALIPKLEGSTSICVIHNASILEKDIGSQVPSRRLREILEVNVVAQNSITNLLRPHMKPSSSVLFVGSTLSEKAVPGNFSYVTSKHAQVGMMRALCQDFAGSGIHTALICPGFTDTEMLRRQVPSEAIEAVAGLSTFGRLIEASEISSVLLWSAQNPVINGSVIHANLGQVER